jgi:hypothetical protein
MMRAGFTKPEDTSNRGSLFQKDVVSYSVTRQTRRILAKSSLPRHAVDLRAEVSSTRSPWQGQALPNLKTQAPMGYYSRKILMQNYKAGDQLHQGHRIGVHLIDELRL